MKAKEVKKILGITQYTLYRYLKEGKVKLSSKLSKTDYEELKNYAERKKFGSIKTLALFAMNQYITKYPIKNDSSK